MKRKKIIGIICSDTQAAQIENMLQFPNIIVKRIDKNRFNKIIRLLHLIKDTISIDILYLGHGTGNFPYAAKIARLFHKKVIIHWIGTDVVDYKKSKLQKMIRNSANLHLACSSLIAEELSEYEIKAKVVPIVPLEMDFELSIMPNKHAALFYLPTGREDFYGIKYLEYLSKKYINVDFYVVGNEKKEFNQSNIINLGKISLKQMNELYDKISILVRIPEHDGLSIMLLEALLRGKQVLYCYDFPFTYHVKSLLDADKCMKKITSEKPKLNIEGRNYVLEEYDLTTIKEKLYKLLTEECIF